MQNNDLEEAEKQLFKDGWAKIIINYSDGTNSVVYASPRGLEAVKNSGCNFVILND